MRPGLVLLGLLCTGFSYVVAAGARAQGEPLYPALDVPVAVTLAPDSAGGGAHDAAAPAEAAADFDFDASHFTASPNLDVRDLDGDRHLDATWLFDGVHVWLGRGDGRFDQGSFQPTTISSTSPLQGQWGDANGDGRPDAVFLTFTRVEIFFDQGDGSFGESTAQSVPGVNDFNPASWAPGFVDGDDHLDLVARNYHVFPGTKLQILYGLGGSSFAAPVDLAAPQGFAGPVGLGDLDGNGLTDVVAFIDGIGTYTLKSWIQTAPGVFAGQPSVPAGGTSSQKLELRDMSGDGIVDVVDHQWTQTFLYVCDGTGALPATPIALPGVQSDALFVDLDGDGLVDVLQTTAIEPFVPSAIFARADGTLSPPVVTVHEAEPLGTGDFDEDGLLDLWSPQAPLLGRGDGSFGAPRNFSIGVHVDSARRLALADFDEDGTLDVAATDIGHGLYVTLSELAATWRPPVALAPGYFNVALASGDLDGDGHADLVASRPFIGGTDVWRGLGTGGFTEQAALIFSGFENTGIGIGDFDGSPNADVVATTDGLLRVRLGFGNFTFGAERQTALPTPSNNPWLLVRDLDGDGVDDVLVSQSSGVYSLHCKGQGQFDPAVFVTASASQLTLADLDGDGDDDLLASGSQTVRALLGDGDGHFQAAPFPAVDTQLTALGTAVADADGDGLLDLAVGHLAAWSLFLGAPGGGWNAEPADVFDLPGAGFDLRFLDANADGRPDLLAVGRDGAGSPDGIGLTLAVQQEGPWSDLGFGLPGATQPELWPTGSLVAGTPMSLLLHDAFPHAHAYLVLGLSELSLPFKGGTLVPQPLLVLPGPPISSAGSGTLSATWPAGIPARTSLWLQCWMADPSGPAGFTASNAVRGTTP